MSRIEDLIKEHCPNGVEYEALSQIGEWYGGGTPSKGKPEYWKNGTIPWVSPKDMGKAVVDTSEDYITAQAVKNSATRLVPPTSVAMVVRSSILDRIFPTALIPVPVALNQDMKAVVPRPGILPSYIAHLLRSMGQAILRAARKTGGSVASIDSGKLYSYRVPMPPIEVQREIVRILDTFSNLEARRDQYDYYQRKLLVDNYDNGYEWKSLGELGKVAMCKRIFKNETSPEGDIPFYKVGTFGGKADAFIAAPLYEDYRLRFSFPKVGDVLISAAGTIGRAVLYDGSPAYFQDSNIVWIDNDESHVLNRYLYHWYRVAEWSTDGGIIQRLYNESLRNTKIRIPPKRQQERVIDVLDKFDVLVNDLSAGLPAELNARRRQYEHYRDRLLTFREAV